LHVNLNALIELGIENAGDAAATFGNRVSRSERVNGPRRERRIMIGDTRNQNGGGPKPAAA
jgi:hypothetical protein